MSIYRVYYRISNDPINSRDFAAESISELIFYLRSIYDIADSDIIKIKLLKR